MHRFSLLVGVGLNVAALLVSSTGRAQLPGQSPEQAAYTSPYSFAPAITDPELTRDFHEGAKAIDNWRNWSTTPNRDWHNLRVVDHLYTTWGPHYIDFRAPRGVGHRPVGWLQERLVAAASVVRNTAPYKHHHVAQWDCPDDPRWTMGHPRYEAGFGFDCSDFTHFVYSYGLGILLDTGIQQQSNMTQAKMHLADGAVIEVGTQRLFDVQNGYVNTYDDLTKNLQPGDLLFIRGNAPLDKPITHVIMWMGNLATDPSGKDAHLVMDSHGAVVKDSNGILIPSGPELRPFHEKSWYFNSYDHVIRFVPLVRR